MAIGSQRSFAGLLKGWNGVKASILLVGFVVLLTSNCDAWKFPWHGKEMKFAVSKKQIASALIGASFFSGSTPSFAADTRSLQAQLQAIQQQQQATQKRTVQTAEEDQMTRIIQLPEGRLIARGTVSLETTAGNPFGQVSADALDPSFASKDATMFLLAVGREGPPLAAKRIKLADIKFPYVFEILSSDLVFPYTEDAWLKSSNSKDTIACTAIITPGTKLSVPTKLERFGFGLSDPLTFAGVLSRSSAVINVNGKLDDGLYTPEEVALLSTVDDELDRLAAGAAGTNTGGSGSSSGAAARK